MEITLDKHGNFRVVGKLKDKHPKRIVLSEYLTEVLKVFQKIGKSYSHFLKGDQKLVGQEKANLVMQLNNFASIFLTIQFYLEMVFLDSNIISAVDINEGYKFKVTLDDYDYTISGKFSGKIFAQVTTVKNWYSDFAGDQIKKFIGDVKAALKDGNLDKQEVEWMNKRISAIVHSVFIIQYRLTHSSVDI